MDYIEAFFDGDNKELQQIEEHAKKLGAGPRAECRTTVNFSAQRSFCREFS